MSVKHDLHYLNSQTGWFMTGGALWSKKMKYKWKKRMGSRTSKTLLYHTLYGGTGDGRDHS